jgi:uncharacterized protein
VIKLDIGTIPEGSSEVALSVEAAELGEPPEDIRLETPVEVRLSVTRNGDDIFLKGKARVGAVLECARCLEKYSLVLESPVGVWCILGAGGESADAGERENVIEVAADRKYVDLTDHLRSELLVLIPLKPLCKAECKGLCPKCGVNLNVGGCSCDTNTHDSRWDALKKIK